ncbi:hypothetical protein AYO20_03952 [Fonsecaea nubica]|uniref:ABM domain-containing protein n=1 Tax=Fonsecaea nubica TaxID=856822 RepID=A0A178D563_9EURO|nr:hypothetical protein AYO20_03952 [Fonsecaea nubica]OAL36896.1 hypothetical protein AYO20_03952 [Fonsecaea nubica]
MPIATEIAQFSLIPGQDPRKAGSSAAQFLQKTLDIVKQQPGFLRGFWGIQDGDPSALVVVVDGAANPVKDWEDIKHHQDLVNSQNFAAMTENLVNVITFDNGPPVVTHVNFTSDASNVYQASVTAVESFRVPEDASQEQKSALEDSFVHLAKFYTTKTACSGYASGWVVETLPDDNAPGAKVLSFTGIFGWPVNEEVKSVRSNPGDPAVVDAMDPITGVALPRKKGDAFHVSLRRFG